MEKPLSLKIESAKDTLRQEIALTAQANKLPYFIMEQVIESVLLEVKNMSKSDLQRDVSLVFENEDTTSVKEGGSVDG